MSGPSPPDLRVPFRVTHSAHAQCGAAGAMFNPVHALPWRQSCVRRDLCGVVVRPVRQRFADHGPLARHCEFARITGPSAGAFKDASRLPRVRL